MFSSQGFSQALREEEVGFFFSCREEPVNSFFVAEQGRGFLLLAKVERRLGCHIN